MAMFERRRTTRSGKLLRGSILFIFLGLIVLVLVVFSLYGRVFESNVSIENEHIIFYVKTGSSFEDVLESLASEEVLSDERSFKWVAKKKEYPQNIVIR